jgi:predicted lipid-binding transport protein (Tim44 family)
MRKKTLAGLASMLAFGLLFGLRFVGIKVPFTLAGFFVFLLLVPLLIIPLTLLNKRVLAWRKARGRDIEEEEKCEREASGITSLRPKTEAEMEEDEKRHLHPMLR